MKLIKLARLSSGLKQIDVLPVLLNIDPRMTIPRLSDCEQGIVNPTPRVFHALCRLYKKQPHELACKSDFDYGITVKRHQNETGIYKLTVRVPRDLIGSPERLHSMVKSCGYADITAWQKHCIKNLEAHYTRIVIRNKVTA